MVPIGDHLKMIERNLFNTSAFTRGLPQEGLSLRHHRDTFPSALKSSSFLDLIQRREKLSRFFRL